MSAASYKSWDELRGEISELVKTRGVQSWLSKELKVSRTAVSKWIRKKSAPSADAVLFLANWAGEERAKQKEGRDSASTPPRRKAHATPSKYEKRYTGPRKR